MAASVSGHAASREHGARALLGRGRVTVEPQQLSGPREALEPFLLGSAPSSALTSSTWDSPDVGSIPGHSCHSQRLSHPAPN